jgi:hypothetical protein
MGAGHFLNGKMCNNCKVSWWEFDRCCSNPSISVNPHEIARYGNQKPWNPPREQIEEALKSAEMTIKRIKAAMTVEAQ